MFRRDFRCFAACCLFYAVCFLYVSAFCRQRRAPPPPPLYLRLLSDDFRCADFRHAFEREADMRFLTPFR